MLLVAAPDIAFSHSQQTPSVVKIDAPDRTQMHLPRNRVTMMLVAAAEQCDPKAGVGEKVRRQRQPRFGVP